MTAPEGSLRGRRILVAEDEYHITEEVIRSIADEGAEVIGPVSTLAEARALATNEARIDGALLDVNLGGEMIWPVVDSLLSRGVAVVLTTGYDAASIPASYAGLPRCEKPVALHELTRALLRSITS